MNEGEIKHAFATDFDDVVSKGATVCTKSGTAYSAWLDSSIRGLNKKEFGPE